MTGNRRGLVPAWTCAFALAATTMMASCGDDSDPEPEPAEAAMNVKQATDDLESFLRSTASDAAPGADLEPTEQIGPSPCLSDQVGRELDTFEASSGFDILIETGSERDALDRVVSLWRDEGIELDTSLLDSTIPEVKGPRTGYWVRVTAVADSGQITLDGATDCLPPAED